MNFPVIFFQYQEIGTERLQCTMNIGNKRLSLTITQAIEMPGIFSIRNILYIGLLIIILIVITIIRVEKQFSELIRTSLESTAFLGGVGQFYN